MIDLTFIGDEGNVTVRFDGDPSKVRRIVASRELADKIPALDWIKGFVYAEARITPRSLKQLEASGYLPHGEELDWFRTGKWSGE